VNGVWVEKEGYNKIHHYSIVADTKDCFELRFNTDNMLWTIGRVYMDG
jgi:hypothetical protein